MAGQDLEARLDRALRTKVREVRDMAARWADSSGLPQTVYMPRGGVWKHIAAAMHDAKGGERYDRTILPGYYFGHVDGRAAAAHAKLKALGFYRY